MTRTAIDDPWREGDDGPEPLEAWLAEGFERAEAESWRGWRFGLSAAHAWRRAGVTEALDAARWATARATPDTVGVWQAAGMDATEAVQWHEFGIEIDAAKRLKALGHGPNDVFAAGGPLSARGVARAPRRVAGFSMPGVPGPVMHSYAARQWFDDEARAWAREHVDAGDAQLWKQLGIRPHEAGRAIRRGLTVLAVVRDWWRAGIPFDEVADWLGAGLSADEAAAQRAKGITAEQAAALRALRDEPDDDERAPHP